MIINELKNSKIPKIQIVSKLKSLQTQYSQYFQRTYYFNIKTLMKEGINHLGVGESWQRRWSVEVY
jgi:hypothetical protein